MLVLILEGFVAGLYRQVGAYLENSPGTVLVTQQGVRNLLGASSLLPTDSERDARRIQGFELLQVTTREQRRRPSSTYLNQPSCRKPIMLKESDLKKCR